MASDLLSAILTGPPSLPGDIPGLLRRGCPVVHPAYGRGLVDIRSDGEMVVRDEHGLTRWTEGADPKRVVGGLWWALDLTDEAGVDRAARWLAERVDLAQGVTAPVWEPSHWRAASGRAWRLHRCWLFAAPYPDSQNFGAVSTVPALARLDLADPLVDVRALAICCAHIARRLA